MTNEIVTRPAFTVAAPLLERAARMYGIDPLDITKRNGERKRHLPRFAVVWVLRQFVINDKRYSYNRIAKLLGFKDHTTARHAFVRAEEMRRTSGSFRRNTDRLLELAMSIGPQVSSQLEAA
jgi:chromosomal replication initiation ATPase DnaA